MTKIYVPLPSTNKINFYLEQDIDGFIVGIKELSMNFNSCVDYLELENIINIVNNKEIYVSLNKLYYEKDMSLLKKVLKKISLLKISGLFFSDISIYNIVRENKYDINLIWNANHLGTNYKTVNYWYNRNVKKSILSTEITLDEILDINKKTNSKIGIFMYGYLNMVTSSRTLLNNYFTNFNLEKKYDNYYLSFENEKYNIVEKSGETNIFSSKVLNAIEYFPSLIKGNIDFIILDDYLIDSNSFYNVIEAFTALRRNPDDNNFINQLKKVVEVNTNAETFLGFFNKKSIYRVKSNE